MTYTQCKLQNGDLSQIVWIPSQFAKVSKVLQLREEGGWFDGWVVMEVWQTVSEDQLPDEHAERKAHKRATGDVAC